MKKALISPNENAYSFDGTYLGIRVAQVEENAFEVASPLFWIDCEDDIKSEEVYYDMENSKILIKPVQVTNTFEDQLIVDFEDLF